MAAFIIKDAQALYGGRNVSGILNQVGVSYSNDVQEVTTLDLGTRKRIPGLVTAEFNLQGFWEAADDAIFFSDIGSAGEVMTVMPDTHAEGSRAYFMQGTQESYVQGASIGEVFPFTLNMQSNNPLVRGRNIAEKTQAADGNGTGYQFAALGANDRMFAVLHVLSASGTSPTLNVTITSDATADFDSSTSTRITFDQVTTTTGAQIKSVAGAITDTFWRAEWLIDDDSAGSPSYQFLIAIGITDK